MSARRIVQEPEFQDALRELACPRARWMVQQLAGLLLAYPQSGLAIDGSTLRVVHTNVYEDLPALRLYYRFDDKALYLIGVEVYDPLLP